MMKEGHADIDSLAASMVTMLVALRANPAESKHPKLRAGRIVETTESTFQTQVSYSRRSVALFQSSEKALWRDPVQVGVLIRSKLGHRNVSLLAATVTLHQNTNNDQEECQGTCDGKTDQNDKAKSEMMS